MTIIPENLTKRYYTIGEVAAMFGVTRSLIRFWEKEFQILKPFKSSKGERRFTSENIKQFQLIYQLVKEKGYTLNGARKFIQDEKVQIKQKKESVKTLIKIRGFLEDLKLQI
jgi:DNA-binding transcriptional MerR regulator